MKKILKASAGTGKTYRLSLEYVAALLMGIDFKEIVVMTFTRKATAEIRVRIFEHIEDILHKKKSSEVFKSLIMISPDIKLDLTYLQQIYNRMLQNKEAINIYTIDSFINQIFKQAIAPYLGIYNYQIVDDDKNKEILEGVFKELLDNPVGFALMEKFLTENTERDIDNYINLIEKMLNNRWKFLLIDHQPRQEKNTEKLTLCLDQCLQALNGIAVAKQVEFSEELFVKDYQSLITEYIGLEDPDTKRDIIIKNSDLFFNKTFWNGSKIRGKAVASLKEDLEAEYQEFLTHLAGYIYNQVLIPYEEEIFKFSERVFAIYDQIKLKEKTFTHTDISNYTYKYFFNKDLELVSGSIISDYFYELVGTEINCLFIDEFQDTSILQWKILKPVIDSSQNVIAVGDEKQSIYGWRGGEKELFSKLETILEGKSESLLTCYRSEKEILGFVNRFFSGLAIDWQYENVNHLPEKDKGYVKVLLGGERTRTNTQTKTFYKKSIEKQEEIIGLNEKICGDLKHEIVSQISQLSTYKGVGVLARANNDLSDIATELDKAGIPYIQESKDSLIEHKAVKPIYFLLSYLNYHDYFQLVKFLRSDLIGINNRVLKYILQNKQLIEDFMVNENIQLEYEDIEQLLLDIKQIKELDYRQLTTYIIKKSGIVREYSDNAGALKNIYYFFKLMRGYNCLPDFMTYLEENIDSEELKQPGVRDENAVRLMTIHKAKGLSFETEFFYWKPGSGNGGSPGSMEIYTSFDQKYEKVDDYFLTNSRYEKIFEYLGINFAEKQEEKELMEEINNVYVALTRPEKNLFLYIEGPRKLDPGKERCWQGSSYQFYEEAVLKGARVDRLVELVEGKELGRLIISGEEQIENGKNEIKIPALNDYFKVEKLVPEKMVEVNSKKDFDLTLEKEINRINGLVIHYYLEHIKYDTEKERDYARKMCLARYGNILGPYKMKELFRRIEGFIESNPEYFTTCWQVFTEYELRYQDEFYRIDRMLVNEEKKEIVILDYKSGVSREQSQLNKYREIIRIETEGKYRIQAKFVNIGDFTD